MCVKNSRQTKMRPLETAASTFVPRPRNSNFRVVIMVDPSVEIGRGLVRGIANYTYLAKSWKIYRHTRYNWKEGSDKKELNHIKEWAPDGIITDNIIPELKDLGVPIISMENGEQPLSKVGIFTDDEQVGKLAAEHFLDRGFCEFAFCGFDDLYWSQQRGANFAQRVAQVGHETRFYRQPRIRSERAWRKEQVNMVEWLKSLPQQVGILAANDDRGSQIADCCDLAGLNVPGDVAILGVGDDHNVCLLSNPPLSSIAFNAERVGYEVAESLNKMMAGHKLSQQKILIHPTHIVTRHSSNIMAVKDLEVANALHYIQTNSRKNICVGDVLATVPISRRSLERRFHREIGRSLHNHILRVRTEEVCKMLLETNMSVAQIARELNFTSIEHVSRSFRKYTGMSPLAYRKSQGHI